MKTPMSSDTKLTKDEECESVDNTKYQGMIGSLLYLTASRPGIMFIVCLCVHFQEAPKSSHLEEVKRIFRYIKGTTHLGLWYPKGTNIETVVYADSDHTGDYVDRKSTSDDIQAAGSDTRPPMLDRTDYESWSQRIRLYYRGKENGLQIFQSIDQGPFELGTTRDTLGTTSEGGVLLGPERPRTYDDLNDDEKKRYDADVRATNIVLITKEDRESQLYDEFERFRMLPGENINEYYVRFHKLVNDMMTMPNIQLNSKFVNNMSPEWDRFVTAVKLNKGLKETNHEQLYAYLKQHEKHAAQDRLIIERITPSTNDPLAFVSSVQPYSQPSQSQSHQYQSSTTPPQSQNVQSIPYSQFAESSSPDSGYTQTEEILNTLSKQFALLTQSFRATLPQTNNQLRTSSNTRNQATIQDGQIVVQNVQGRQNQNQRNFARGNGAAGFGGMQNRAGNANAGQGKPVKCYNCNGVGHIARNCTQPNVKRMILSPFYDKVYLDQFSLMKVYQLKQQVLEQQLQEQVLEKEIVASLFNDKMTTISSGLVPQSPSPTPNVPPTNNDWDSLFYPMFDEYFNYSPSVVQHVLVAIVQGPVVSTGTPSSTRIDQDTPSTSTSQTSQADQSHVIPTSVEEDDHGIEVAHMDNDLPISTRLQLQTETLFCYYDDLLSSSEHKSYKDALPESCWIDAMKSSMSLNIWRFGS
ncbi:retrovirus-related pol polyprotein from transposon TNT 1-94 [Tanacetum coccineum]